MGEFFKGCRRKIGVLTLLLACVGIGGWVRSLAFTDSCFFSIGGIWQFGFVSNYGHFGLGVARFTDDVPLRWNSAKQSRPIRIETIALMFDFIGQVTHHNQRKSQPIFSYWSITIPMTLISLWLLLSKPRKSTQVKTIESIAEKVV